MIDRSDGIIGAPEAAANAPPHSHRPLADAITLGTSTPGFRVVDR